MSSAELVGVSQRALDLTVEYVKERKQFGVAVGTFQAVQHKAAQMLLDTEGGRSATYFAAWTADAEPDRLGVAAALGQGLDVGPRPATPRPRHIQLHGGIGFTWEADVHWWYKRAQLDAALPRRRRPAPRAHLTAGVTGPRHHRGLTQP